MECGESPCLQKIITIVQLLARNEELELLLITIIDAVESSSDVSGPSKQYYPTILPDVVMYINKPAQKGIANL